MVHKVPFISTPRNIEHLPKLPPNIGPFLNFVKPPIPHIEKPEKNAEATPQFCFLLGPSIASNSTFRQPISTYSSLFF